MNNIQVNIGCDLLGLLKAKLDFQAKQLIIPLPNAHPTLANLQQNTLGQLELTRKEVTLENTNLPKHYQHLTEKLVCT